MSRGANACLVFSMVVGLVGPARGQNGVSDAQPPTALSSAAVFVGGHDRASENGAALLGPVGPSRFEVATEVNRNGFYAGRAIGDEVCAGCHPDTAAQWRSSAHRFSSFNNPYYRFAATAFRRERGPAASNFCGGCHDPVLVATGAFERPDFDPVTPAAQAGITCVSCHMIEAVDVRGNGGYLARPAPFAIEQPFHRARLLPELLHEPKFCGTCHKVGLVPELTKAGWLRGQNDFDPWLVSAVSGNGAGSIYRPSASRRCQDCHMPLEPAGADLGAKNGSVRSHRFLAANTALPHLRGDRVSEDSVQEFLRGSASVDLIWNGNNVDAVLRARGVGHRFPGGTNDSNEVWLQVQAFDLQGMVIGSSGLPDARGVLPSDTHLIRAQPVDDQGEPLRLRDVQHMRAVIFDTALLPSDPQVVRFTVPQQTAQIRARLLYRKFSPAYATSACALVPDVAIRKRCEEVPAVEIAAAHTTPADRGAASQDWMRLLDHGLGLADAPADRAAEARVSLEASRALAPARPDPVLGLARLANRMGRTDEVLTLTAEALALAPGHPAALYLQVTALVRAYRFGAALEPAQRLATRLPGDIFAQLLLARVRGLCGDATGSLSAAAAALRIDPESEDGHLQSYLSASALGRTDDMIFHEERFLRHRVPIETEVKLRHKWRRRFPEAADESTPVHTHMLRPPRL